MISRQVVWLGAVVLLAAACGGEAVGGDRVRLRFGPPAGTTQQYVIDQHTTMQFEGGPMAGLGEQQVTMRMFITQAVVGPGAGGTTVALTFDSTHLDMGSLPAARREDVDKMLRRMRGMGGQLVLDERMQVVRATFSSAVGLPPNMGEQLGSTVRGLVFPFPKQAVRVGDSWTEAVELPLGQLPGNPGPVRAATTVTLREIRAVDGDTTVVFDVVSAMPKEPILVRAEGQEVTFQLEGALEGEQTFSIRRGMPSAAAMAGVVRMTVSGAFGGTGEMTLVLNQRIAMRTVGGP